ncbi:MAG: helix-turn-helix transcriptional regulator [Miniphocaeibacter sp.]|uniref:Helix-turn-helix transcriptional regulator n=1 Tax=Miniphocaeibacter halophilus TaxID=2931922 RepID=A0AC61MRA9_9FIRM|nr:helix-turn-helix transcriptional regulator [Miniphocaeibacter halophilus]QQK06961.1 helix-turn-helix transcriptional regulator [Miniphocaeibacter halophilus]HHX69706.1 helix-turn-helix transcriptional regulator [Gallicola sp.]
MYINYKGLWKLLIDKDMKKSDLRVLTKMSTSTLSKLTKDEYVSMDVLVRICRVLKCQLSDICEVEV